MNPKYPVYIISKGRSESRLTAKALETIKVPYNIVIEPQEYDDYVRYISPKKILTLPFSNLGQGSIPARNWVWEHALSLGVKRHWILDDNIRYFGRWNRNNQIQVASGTIFKCSEDFVDRYNNIGLSGFNYDYIWPMDGQTTPIIINTRIYSCILIKNDLKFRWRGKYNEDTDLSLRVLKDGWCTILFNAFLSYKVPTLQMKGGNTDNVYIDGDDRLKFAESLQKQHPDIVKVVWRYNRYHHQVNYRLFKKNKLILRKGIVLPKGINNYGMVLKEIKYL